MQSEGVKMQDHTNLRENTYIFGFNVYIGFFSRGTSMVEQ